MAWKTQGYSHDDIRDGFDIIRACKTAEELRAVIDEQPILRTSAFHRFLRHAVGQIRTEEVEDPLARWVDEFFLILHRRIHAECLQLGLDRPVESHYPQAPLMPEYLRVLIAACAGRIPESIVNARHPERDRGQIEADLAAMRHEHVRLPPYEQMPGVRWSALVVDCPRCKQPSIVAHAHLVDLVAAPDLKDALCAGQINVHRCFQCSHVGFTPRFTWIQEPPGSKEELNAAATIWRLDTKTIIYQAPTGTIEDNNNDVVFETCCDELLRQIGDDAFEPVEPQTSMSLVMVYDHQQLVDYIDGRDEPDALPADMFALVSTLGRQLSSRAMAPHFAEEYATSFIARMNSVDNWPLMVVVTPLVRDIHEHLALCIIAESLARFRREPAIVLATLAGQVSEAFYMIGEVGLAERALARAEDAARELSHGAERAYIEMDFEETRAALAVKVGDHATAARIRRKLLEALPDPKTLLERMHRPQIAVNLALNLMRTNELADAFVLFQRETAALGNVLDDARRSTDEVELGYVETITNSLSGAFANWSTLMTEIVEDLEVIHYVTEVHPIAPEKRPPRHIAINARHLDSIGLDRVAALDAVLPLLTEHIAKEVGQDPATEPTVPLSTEEFVILVKKVARQMLERTLLLAESVKGWTFAGRQAERLAAMQEDAGEDDAAERSTNKVIEYAARMQDHRPLIRGYLFFANRAGKKGDGVTALEYIRNAARESMREIIGFGIHARESDMHRALRVMAIQCARFKASAPDAIAITESLKGVAMSVSLERGQVFAGDVDDKNRQNTITTLRTQQEQLRFQAILNPNDIQIRQNIEIIDEKVKAARNEAILRDPRYGRWCDANALDVSIGRDLHRKLAAVGPRATYLGFFRHGYDVWTYVFRAGEAFVPRVQDWPFADDDDGNPRIGARPIRLDETRIKQWSALLLGPLVEQLMNLRPEDPLIVSVDEEIMDIPFAALELRGKRLCECATISVIHGIGMLEECVERQNALKSVLCIGDPQRFDSAPLPAAGEEVETISKQFRATGGTARELLAERATVRALREASPTADVLHFACHARSSGVAPSDNGPRLLLAIDDNGHDSGHLSDDRLLAEIVLKEGALVNLAACSSDEQGGGHGPITRGLVPAFLIKGASAVLSSLWAIDDFTASQFNARFYELLLSGRRPAAALAETQRACIAGELGYELADPAAWAGYRLWGAR